MIALKSIDLYACASRAIVLSQRSDFLGCVMIDHKYQLHQCTSTTELLQELNKGEKIFSILYGTMKVLNGDNAFKKWVHSQIQVFNANLQMN